MTLESLEDRSLLAVVVLPVPSYLTAGYVRSGYVPPANPQPGFSVYGSAPTAAAMVLGYWDSNGYRELFSGSATTQTPAVSAAIASTGHMSDYAFPDDKALAVPTNDKSVAGATPAPHPSDSIADFMRTSFSVNGLRYGETNPTLIDDGLDLYAHSRGFPEFTAREEYKATFTWEEFVAEIDAGRPMVLVVDSDGNGRGDEAVAAIGYDTDGGKQEFIFYTSLDHVQRSAPFASAANGQLWGIDHATYLLPSSATGVDLVGNLTDVPSQIAWGQTFTIEARVQNLGNLPANNNFVQWFYLSSNPVFGDADDISLGYYSHPAGVPAGLLGPAFTVTATLPSTPPAGYEGTGPFYIGMRTNGPETLVESNYRNNGPYNRPQTYDWDAFSLPGTDLQGSRLSAPDQAEWGSVITVLSQVYNAGGPESGNFTTRWYISDDAVASVDDVPLSQLNANGANYVHGSIAPAAYGPLFAVDLQMPSTRPAGFTDDSFYLIQLVDYGNVVLERNEGNNFGQLGDGIDREPIGVVGTVDLYGGTLSAPAVAPGWGQTINVNFQVHNGGTGDSGPFRVRWYLSTDAAGDDGDVALYWSDTQSDFYHASVAANADGPAQSVALRLPTVAPSGFSGNNFYIVQRVDAAAEVAESNEGNNFGQLGLGVDVVAMNVPSSVDLEGWYFYAADRATWGQTVAARSQIHNGGTGAVGPFEIQWYLSKDEVASGDDILLSQAGGLGATYVHPGLGAQSYGSYFDVSLQMPDRPAGWTGDRFYLLQRLDPAGTIAESNEGNNFGELAVGQDRDFIVIVPPIADLQGWKTAVYTPTTWGDAFHLGVQLYNGGTADAGLFQVEWYLSRDTVGSADDVPLMISGYGSSIYVHGGIAAKAFGPDFTVTLDMPAVRPTGWSGSNFYILQRTDVTDAVGESNEGNNFGQLGEGIDRAAVSILFSEGIDLAGQQLNGPVAAQWGQAINVQSRVANGAPTASGAFSVQWFLSQDPLGSADDVLLSRRPSGNSYAHPSIAGNSTGPLYTVSLQLPAAPPAGWTGTNFYLVQKVDSAAAVVEADEDNNFGQMGLGADALQLTLLNVPFVSQLSATGSGTNHLSQYAAASMLAGNAWGAQYATTQVMQDMAQIARGTRYPTSPSTDAQALAGLQGVEPTGATLTPRLESVDFDGLKTLVRNGVPVSIGLRYSALGANRINTSWAAAQQVVVVGYSELDGTWTYLDPFGRSASAALRTVSNSVFRSAVQQLQGTGNLSVITVR